MDSKVAYYKYLQTSEKLLTDLNRRLCYEGDKFWVYEWVDDGGGPFYEYVGGGTSNSYEASDLVVPARVSIRIENPPNIIHDLCGRKYYSDSCIYYCSLYPDFCEDCGKIYGSNKCVCISYLCFEFD